MNAELVAEFLGGVPLLQRLPSSSLRKIAQVIKVEHYDEGEHVIRNGDSKGVYFIFEGEAEVCGNSEEDIRPEFILKRYDYFGDGAPTSEQQADVIASSKLTCFVLPSEHCYLLQPKSIWNADERQETCAPVETILHLDPIEVNLFQGITLPSAPKFGKVFGGQFIGHALAAASKTVDCLKIVHHLQAYFLLVGDIDIPILYEVHRLRDGKSFSTRRVDAKQKGNIVFTLLASFQKEEKGFEHQEAVMPSAPAPDTLLSLEELRERRIIDPRLPRTYRNKVVAAKYDTWPIDIRFVDPISSTNQTKSPARLKYWLRAKGKLTDDQALHRCVVAYASDLMFIGVSANPHRQRDLKINVLSLNHTMWFHRPLKADDWLLFVIESPSSSATRGLVTGQMFNQKGELVVTLVQEGLLRVVKSPPSAIRAKI
ncbi:acyl-CoA hydrolase 2-like [Silene latifolia]|uniref:acyl-CoA hydrolase 2-like n=1 Tax=Silene latifolia TaxID=37657 RepID=UPI003D78369D